MWCPLNVDPTKGYENGFKVIVYEIQSQAPQWIAQWNNLALLLYININWAHAVTSGQDHLQSQFDCGVVGLVVSQVLLLRSLAQTHINHTYCQVARPPNSQVKCLSHAIGKIPRSNACLVQLCRVATQRHDIAWTTHIRSSHTVALSLGEMSVSCSWATQTPDSIVKPI